MTAKSETLFYRAVHTAIERKYVKKPYIVKMNNPFSAGMPDVYYSGGKGDLWVEYKFEPAFPVRSGMKPKLSAHQNMWLTQRHDEGRNVAVIMGIGKKGGVIYRAGQWATPLYQLELRERYLDIQAIADWIYEQVGAGASRLVKQ